MAVGALTFNDGEETGRVPPVQNDGDTLNLSGMDGSFTLVMQDGLGPCPPPAFPVPDEVEVWIARESLPEVLDIQPELRTGDNLRIVCPCYEQYRVPINEQTAEYTEPLPEDPRKVSFLELREPIPVAGSCATCCTLLVLRGRLAEVSAEEMDGMYLSVERRDDLGDRNRFFSPRRVRSEADGSFEAWFSDAADSCPPGQSFEVPDALSVTLAEQPGHECARQVNVELASLNVSLVITKDDPDGSFPRTVVEIVEPLNPDFLPWCQN